MFQQKRDQIDDIFVKLPPPKPSVRRARPTSHSSSTFSSPSYVNMGSYHNAAGPCFAGDCLVEVVSHAYFGTSRIVDDLRAMRGWHAGLVELFPALCPGGKCMIRDKETGVVCGFFTGISVQTRAV
eukprot:Phypoly_transcript_27211.p1 GENE.Phypoly_transcript_27211~~Phypoly_transcript_27211.p1  ORF type:complete len:126 (+),score=19.26 Phypoly_transcript_27211:1-378(+)